MKALFVVTGRGLGGDAMIALNVMSALEKRGIICDVALDESAPGVLFEKHGYSHSLPLAIIHGISTPAGTEMFH